MRPTMVMSAGIKVKTVDLSLSSRHLGSSKYGTEFTGIGELTHDGGGIFPIIAVSDNVLMWESIGSLVRGEDNKDHLLFPRRINGRYVALHGRPPQIWLAESEDLVTWPEQWMRPIFEPRPENGWDEKRVGGNGVPIETDEGWLTLHHAFDDTYTYRIGVCLLDKENPSRVIGAITQLHP
jgi:predicted GH43/DUF377 family glycosyl hydrolase